MRVYISGPISHTTDYMERFSEAQKKLEARGYDVINPALINSNLPESTTWCEYMKISLLLLDMCDAICLLDDWGKSKGARIECYKAICKKMKILRGRLL